MLKLIAGILLLTTFNCEAQYKNDNVLYKTVYADDLAEQLKANPTCVILDVRSQGEYADTSAMGMNIGHLKNAKNYDVRQLGKRINELQAYKNTPVFVYCSHSQRSRRASKMLADSGFTNVNNINGGMTTLYKFIANKSIYETKNPYTFVSPEALCNLYPDQSILLLDIRSDSAFRGISTNAGTNAVGWFKNSINIPFELLEANLSKIPKDKKIIVIDDFGDNSPKAANILSSHDYKNVSMLFDGIFNFLDTDPQDVPCKSDIWQHVSKFNVIGPEEFNSVATSNKDIAIVDVRKTDEFNNQSKDSWRNGGHIKNAINIPLEDITARVGELNSFKNKPVILYGFGGNPVVCNAAEALIAKGFTNVSVIGSGLFSFRWKAANIKGDAYLKDWVVDIPKDNL